MCNKARMLWFHNLPQLARRTTHLNPPTPATSPPGKKPELPRVLPGNLRRSTQQLLRVANYTVNFQMTTSRLRKTRTRRPGPGWARNSRSSAYSTAWRLELVTTRTKWDLHCVMGVVVAREKAYLVLPRVILHPNMFTTPPEPSNSKFSDVRFPVTSLQDTASKGMCSPISRI